MSSGIAPLGSFWLPFNDEDWRSSST